MAQIARKLPSEVKPRMVDCDLGHSLFMGKGRIKFFCGSSEKFRFPWPRSGQEIVLSQLLPRKIVFSATKIFFRINPKPIWPMSPLSILLVFSVQPHVSSYHRLGVIKFRKKHSKELYICMMCKTFSKQENLHPVCELTANEPEHI